MTSHSHLLKCRPADFSSALRSRFICDYRTIWQLRTPARRRATTSVEFGSASPSTKKLLVPRSSVRLVGRITQPLEVALNAFWFARVAHPPSVPDQLVREENPPVLRNNLHQIPLNLFRVGVLRQVQSFGKPLYVRIHHHPGRDPEPGTQHHVSCLPRHARQRQQLLHRLRHFPAKLLHDFLARAHDGLRLVAKKTGRPDFLLQRAWIGIYQRPRVRILRK